MSPKYNLLQRGVSLLAVPEMTRIVISSLQACALICLKSVDGSNFLQASPISLLSLWL